MKILITGANGMVAKAAAAYCTEIGDDVIALTRQQLDIGDREAVTAAVDDGAYDAILNCAAFTDVDGAESNADACYRANATGVANLAAAAHETGACLVTISTDYVFDGAKDGFYSPDDTPNPQGVYAKSKLEGEELARAANPDVIIVRSGWIFGPGGTNFLSVMPELLSAGKAIKVIDDSFGTPTYAADLARRMRELAELRAAGTFHVTNTGEGTSYFGFAEAICDLGGFDRGLLEPVSHVKLSRPAPRPVNSRLECKKAAEYGLSLMPDWLDGLRRYLKIVL